MDMCLECSPGRSGRARAETRRRALRMGVTLPAGTAGGHWTLDLVARPGGVSGAGRDSAFFWSNG